MVFRENTIGSRKNVYTWKKQCGRLFVKMTKWLRRFARQFRSPATAGSNTLLARYLDDVAAKRVLQSIIAKTNDCLTVRWLGNQVWQYPLDAWSIQEVISDLRPDVIIETGTYLGCSPYF